MESRLRSRRDKDATRLIPWLQQRNEAIKTMGQDAAHELLSHAQVRRYSRNTVIQEQHTPATWLYIVTEGTITVRVESEGIYRELFSYEPGQAAGLLALLDQRDASYQIYASRDCEVVRIDTDHLAQLRAAFHPLAIKVLYAFMPMLTDHQRELDDRAAKLAARKNASVVGSGQTFRRDDRG
ncbi:MAG: Crp/Fnr family transcriptional regulator [Myxococcales bacterium]|nr:Crp/Fnr family transcriptional regulator [Myxococcales bacterium]